MVQETKAVTATHERKLSDSPFPWIQIEKGDKLDQLFRDLTFDALCIPIVDTEEQTEFVQWGYDKSQSAGNSTKRSVGFKKKAEVFEIPSSSLLTRRERSALWHPEPKRKVHVMNPLKLLNCLGKDEERSADEDERGSDSALSEHEMRRLPVATVLSAQENQREEGCNDPEVIAQLYHQCSSQSQMLAQMRAIQDEIDVREYMEGRPSRWRPSFLRPSNDGDLTNPTALHHGG